MTPEPARGRRGRLLIGTGTLVVVATVVLAVTAFAASPRTRHRPAPVTVAKSVQVGAQHEPIAVNTRGLPVYELAPETRQHLLCTSADGCVSVWPPVTVAHGTQLAQNAALKGRLGSFTHDGITQVTLNGHPLYTFTQDHGRGQAHGNELKSFGGTWHVFSEGAATLTSGGGGSTTATSTSSSPTY